MWKRLALVSAGAALTLSVFAAPSPGLAQSVEDFYSGRNVTITVGLSAGGNYDFYARFLAEFYGRHIPGNPNVVVQNMPGAGSRKAANYVYNVAPKDGTVVALTLDTLPLYQALRGQGVKYDLTRVGWIGNMAQLTSAVVVWHTAPATTIEETFKKQVVLGSTGTSSGTYMIPALMNGILDTKFKIVTGFPGTNQINLAMERGEVDGRAGGSWANFRLQKADWIRDGKIAPLAQIGLTKAPGLEDVPLVTDLAKTDDQRKLMNLLASASAFSRAPWLPPGVPADRLSALRRAFDTAMTDSKLQAAAEKRKVLIDPMTGEVLAEEIRKALDISPALVGKARNILGMK